MGVLPLLTLLWPLAAVPPSARPAPVQDPAPAAPVQGPNEAKYHAKLEAPFVAAVEWARTFDEARERARERRALIFAYFTRSYAP